MHHIDAPVLIYMIAFILIKNTFPFNTSRVILAMFCSFRSIFDILRIFWNWAFSKHLTPKITLYCLLCCITYSTKVIWWKWFTKAQYTVQCQIITRDLAKITEYSAIQDRQRIIVATSVKICLNYQTMGELKHYHHQQSPHTHQEFFCHAIKLQHNFLFFNKFSSVCLTETYWKESYTILLLPSCDS